MIGAEAIIKSLEAEGVEYIFGYPGATIAPVYNALTESSIEHILVRHEQHAGHAANAYARVSGKPGVCMVTSGPGALNLVTALGTAYMDSIPLVAITGQVNSKLLGRDVFQEADITGATESFTKYSYLVKNPEDLPFIIKEAFHIASTGRPGPVLIDVPVDIQEAKRTYKFPDKIEIKSYKPTLKAHVGQIKRIVKALDRAEHPVVCAGGGIVNAGVQDKFQKFVDMVNIPVVTTMMGIGSIPTDNPLYRGMVGMHGKTLANRTLMDADLLILLGARVSDRAMFGVKISKQTKIIHVDVDPAEIGKNLDTFIPAVGDLNEVLDQIMDLGPKKKEDEDISKLLADLASKKKKESDINEKYVNPKAFVRRLTDKMPEDYIYCADVGQNQLWSAANVKVTESSRFITTGGMGTMGFSIGAAIGAKKAAPDREVVAVCGDGAFQMSMMELATASQFDVGIKIIVMVNGKLGLVKEIQKHGYGGNYSAIDLQGSPNPLKIGEAYGIPGQFVENDSQVDVAINEMLAHRGAYILVCNVDSEESSI